MEDFTQRERWTFIVRVIVTGVLLLGGLTILLFDKHFGDATQKWAIGALGLVAGYWLR
jgi:hypothetical protein